MSHETFDVLVVGAGIMGLAIARELIAKNPTLKIALLDKEAELGKHSSGRNSGVLHSGIYYPAGSLKAKFCADGSRLLATYCEENALPMKRVGKVILPLVVGDDAALDLLHARAAANGARSFLVDAAQLKEIEPSAHTITGRALHCPDSAIVDSKAVLKQIAADLHAAGVRILFGEEVVEVDLAANVVKTRSGSKFRFGHLFNSSGLQADKVAHACGVGSNYRIMPFKGLYYDLAPEHAQHIRGHIYPVPNLGQPFLGIHFTKDISGKVMLGPNALPALGRENYRWHQDISPADTLGIMNLVVRQYIANKQGFRSLMHSEMKRFWKSSFASGARTMMPTIDARDLQRSTKVGIRAQLYDKQKRELIMDFLVEKSGRTTHVLNAVSPAFTSSFSFAKHMLADF